MNFNMSDVKCLTRKERSKRTRRAIVRAATEGCRARPYTSLMLMSILASLASEKHY